MGRVSMLKKKLAEVRWEGGHVWIRHHSALEKKKYRDMQAPLTPESQKRKLPLVLRLDGNPYARNKADREALCVLFDIADNRRGAFFNILRRPEWAWLKGWAYGMVSEKLARNGRFEPNMGTVALWLFSGYVDFPKCPHCGGPISSDRNVGLHGYGSHCSNRCKTLDPVVQDKIRATVRKDDPNASWTSSTKAAKRHYRQTCQRKYGKGITNAFQAEECKRQIKKTTKERHGDENYRNDEQRIRTNRAKFGGKGSNGDAISETYMIDFTEEQWDDKNEKIRETKARNHGDPNFNNWELAHKTYKEKTGYDCPPKDPTVRAKIEKANVKNCGYVCNLQSPSCKELIQISIFNEYGVENAMNIPGVVDKVKTAKVRHFGMPCSPSWKYSYKGMSFDSSWELAYYIWLEDNMPQEQFEHPCKVKFRYKGPDGKDHDYIPDFRVAGMVIEIKGDQFFDEDGNFICGYFSPDDTECDRAIKQAHAAAKWKCMQENDVVVMRKADVQPYIDYVAGKYGDGYLASFQKTK